MTLSLPLRINLISLVFAALVAAVLTALGGWLLYLQQAENAVNRAKLAADELTVRAGKLLALEQPLTDFVGFDAQCAAVIRNDPLLRSASVFDARRIERFRSRDAATSWPAGLEPPPGDCLQVVQRAEGTLVLRSIVLGTGEPQGYAVVAVDDPTVLASTLDRVAWLLAGAAALFVPGLLMQQGIYWRTVGVPLARLVRTADRIQPDRPESLQPAKLADRCGEDDVGHLYAALARLMQRLLDTRAELMAQNEKLEATVHERTEQLERLNADLARDIERRKQLEEQLRHRASSDALTGLANRGFILPYAQHRLELARREGRPMGLMVMDLDDFKHVNDSHGHVVGDAVLREVARRLAGACRAAEVVARLGGDEFLLAFESFDQTEQVQDLARRMVALFDEPVLVGGLSLPIGLSVGAAWYPLHAESLDGVLAAADAAMYAAKPQAVGAARRPAGSVTASSGPRGR